MNEERQAQLLAQWLDAPAGTPAPEGIDQDVIEAMFVLRPELAPAPKMTAFDLLASLPAAPEQAAAAAAAPEREVSAEVVDLGARRRRRLWYGAGVAAAAAMALIVIVPGAGDLAQAPTASPALSMSDGGDELADLGAALAEAEAPEAARELMDELASAAEQAEGETPAGGDFAQLTPADGPARTAAPAPALDQRTRMAAPSRSASTGATLSLGGSEPASEEDALPSLDGAVVADAELELADFDAAPAARFEGWTQDTGLGAAPAAEPALVPASPEGSAVATDEGGLDDAFEPSFEAPDPYGNVAASKTSSSASRSEKKELRRAERDDLAAAEAAPEQEPAGTPWPADYSASWYLSGLSGELESQVVAAFAAADEHRAAGRVDQAVDTLVVLLASGNTHVAQDAAGRAAEALRAAGRLDEAVDMCRRGRAVSSANTAFLSRLWALEGALHQARGDLAQATHAYTTASNLNTARANVSY